MPDPQSCGHIAGTSPAKVNLVLNVLRKRQDGFHDLRSLVIGVGLGDPMIIAPRDDGQVVLRCNEPSIDGPANLAIRAANEVAHAVPDFPGLTITLTKRIPIAAGMGGGSGNAAFVLAACRDLFGLEQASLKKMALSLGSDVPLFFDLPAVIIEGRGEEVTPVRMNWNGWCLIVHLPQPVSTGDVYDQWRSPPAATASNAADRLDAALTSTRAEQLLSCCANDLEPVVTRLHPQLADLHATLEADAGRRFVMTGAGATWFTLFDTLEEAELAKSSLSVPHCQCHVVAAPAGQGPMLFEE